MISDAGAAARPSHESRSHTCRHRAVGVWGQRHTYFLAHLQQLMEVIFCLLGLSVGCWRAAVPLTGA